MNQERPDRRLKPPEQQRSRQIHIKVTADEELRIIRSAENAGLSVSEWTRRRLLF